MTMVPVLIACLFIGVAALRADEVVYHFNAYLFDAGLKDSHSVAGEGEGAADACKTLFHPPGQYLGQFIPIPSKATAFGVVVVTDGKTAKIIPLFKWVDNESKARFGCNGPTPLFAWQRDSEEALLKAILSVIRKR